MKGFEWLGLSIALLVGGSPPLGSHNEATIVAATDWSTVLRTWRFKGVCVCGGPIPEVGPRTENAFPTGVVEAVKQPGASYLATAATAATNVATEAATALAGLTLGAGELSSSHSGRGLGETGTQFLETHVYSYPAVSLAAALGTVPGLCGPYAGVADVMVPHYYSELDALAWRTGTGDLFDFAGALSYYAGTLGACSASVVPGVGSLSGLFCAGTWGPLYPRRGFVTGHSEVVAAHLLAGRALQVAMVPTGRIVTWPYAYPALQGHYWQMVEPSWRPGYQIGQGIATTEAATTSARGGYLFVHFPILECCLPCYPSRPVGPRAVASPL
ncbi:MAG: TraU family protein [Planctomycetes bacterium]|nr:TraU family protein [Planctomycetota bacterium]